MAVEIWLGVVVSVALLACLAWKLLAWWVDGY